MATRADIDADLTLEIDGHDVTPDKFLRSVRAFFGLVNEISRSLSGPNGEIHWTVQVKSGSNLVGLTPTTASVPDDVVQSVYSAVREGIEAIESDAEDVPGMSEISLKYMRDLAQVSSISEKNDTLIRVWTRHIPVQLTHKTVVNVAAILNEAYEDFGTIEGIVQVISSQGALHVFIMEPIRSRRVRCYVDEKLLPDFMNAFRKRAEITGRVKYRRDGTPISIEASDLSELPDVKDLPSFRDMRGIFRESA
jgi:hypothetical protein